MGIAFSGVKRLLARELPAKLRQTEVSVSINRQPGAVGGHAAHAVIAFWDLACRRGVCGPSSHCEQIRGEEL